MKSKGYIPPWLRAWKETQLRPSGSIICRAFFGCEDKGVYKRSKAAKQDNSPNGGSHINGLLLFPWKSRLRKHPIDLIEDNRKYYIPKGGPLLNIHFTPVHETVGKATDYTFKAIKRGWVSEEDIIILPKSLR